MKNIKKTLQSILLALFVMCSAMSAMHADAATYDDDSPRSEKDEKKAKSNVRRIKVLRKKRDNYIEQIEFHYFKMELHDRCRDCSANCRKQDATGACRHWVRDKFKGEGRYHRVCHQLPDDNRREAGIDQAISSIENKVESIIKAVDKINDQIEELKSGLSAEELAELGDDDVTLPSPPEIRKRTSPCDSPCGSPKKGKKKRRK